MKKRIISIVMVMALCLTLLPATAWAILYPDPLITETTIGSTTLISGTYYVITDGTLSTESASESNYNIYYSTDADSGTHSLTLNNANLKSTVFVAGNTTVTLLGNNVSGSEERKVSIGIQGITPGSITITGTGSYTAYSSAEGIATVQKDADGARSDIVIQGGTISLPGSSIDTRYGGITITGGASVEAEDISTGGDPNYDAAQRARPIVITGAGTKVEAERIDCLTTITVSGTAEVTVKSTSTIAMNASEGIKIEKDATVTAYGYKGGLNSFLGSIEIAGTVDAKATGNSAAVSVGLSDIATVCSITVTGKLTASGLVGAGVSGPGDITIDGGTVTADATLAGIYPMGGGNVEIKNNANVTAGVTSATGIPMGPGIHVKGGSISISNSTVESSTESSNYNAFGAVPTLTYSDSYKVYTGASKEGAALIPHAELADATYQNKYVKIEPAESHTITVTGGYSSVEKTTEGETVTITATVTDGQRFVNWTSDDNVTFADETAAETTFTMPDSDVKVTAVTTSTAQAAPAAAPALASRSNTSITLQEIAANDNDAAAEYGISTDGGETWTWQTSPAFTDLTSGTTYTFAVRYGATENYVASPASETAEFSTVRPSYPTNPANPTYPPAVEEGENGSASVSPKNPSQGDKVTITPSPDKGYEVGSITVSDQNGRPVKITDNGNGTYSFIQPTGKVTISVSYVCNGRTANCPSYHFADVDTSAWYHLAVDFVMETGLMNGYGNGSFGPNNTLTRAELAQILYNNEARPRAGSSGFSDVADGAWYADAVAWAAANGIVEGYGNGKFGPDDLITREQLAVMLWRYAGCPAATQRKLSFTDADEVSSWALQAMLWATENGVINGYNGALNPRGSATRAEAAQMLKNFLENT